MVDEKLTKKILLMGLENSGKTTIVISLKKKTNIISFINLKPTRGVYIENLEGSDGDLSIWDFGGQDKYREEYLSNFYKYTKGVDKIIYVFDVQDIQKYDSALSYLESIMNLLERERITIEISIFLHKFDPNLSKIDEFKDIDDIIKKKILEPISKIIPLSYAYKIFKTTIFAVFEKDLLMKRDNQ